jgi:tRNA A37 threonylcarbamoyladenosine modification protein TsaB
MFLIIDNTETGQLVFYYSLNKKFVQRKYEVKDNRSIIVYLDKLLSELDADLKDIKFLGAVVGYGGFTSTRLAVTVANTLAYALGIPVIGIAKNWRENESDVFQRAEETPVGQYVAPEYSGEANIGRKKTK